MLVRRIVRGAGVPGANDLAVSISMFGTESDRAHVGEHQVRFVATYPVTVRQHGSARRPPYGVRIRLEESGSPLQRTLVRHVGPASAGSDRRATADFELAGT